MLLCGVVINFSLLYGILLYMKIYLDLSISMLQWIISTCFSTKVLL